MIEVSSIIFYDSAHATYLETIYEHLNVAQILVVPIQYSLLLMHALIQSSNIMNIHVNLQCRLLWDVYNASYLQVSGSGF